MERWSPDHVSFNRQTYSSVKPHQTDIFLAECAYNYHQNTVKDNDINQHHVHKTTKLIFTFSESIFAFQSWMFFRVFWVDNKTLKIKRSLFQIIFFENLISFFIIHYATLVDFVNISHGNYSSSACKKATSVKSGYVTTKCYCNRTRDYTVTVYG